MDKKLLRQIQSAILAEPKRYNQDEWHGYEEEMSPDGSCGTVGCIAGWACAIQLGLPDYIKKYIINDSDTYVADDACDYLKIEDSYDGESGRLFRAERWPILLRLLFVKDGGFLRGNSWIRAMAGVIRIEMFIWSGGRV